MIFTQPEFFVFFAVVASIYWALRTNGVRKVWLLGASYFFYGSWDWRFLGLLLLSTLVDYVAALRIEAAGTKARRRAWLYFSLTVNLGVLGFFKYFNFFVENGIGLLHLLGIEVQPLRLDVVLPVGISFFTFQSMSYSIDVYRSRMPTRRSFVDYALFVSFFPQLVAGPIVRASEFLPQLDSKRRLAAVQYRACLVLFLIGFVKKACVADRIAPVVDAIFTDPDAVGVAGRWIGAAMFLVQLYCDFSGYSDMAIASAGLLGYALVENFRFPFVARSVGDFWSRWHISLTTWIRDYLYIWLDAVWLSLGGPRTSRWRIYFALMGVYAAVGLWHGASWNFVLFGVSSGIFVVLETAGLLTWVTSRAWLAAPYMLLFWALTSVFFRSEDLYRMGAYLRGMVASTGPVTRPIDPRWLLLVAGLYAAHVAMAKRVLHDRLARMPDLAFAAVLGVVVGLVLPWVAVDYKAFVYFQF